jgi:hypothetical protein
MIDVKIKRTVYGGNHKRAEVSKWFCRQPAPTCDSRLVFSETQTDPLSVTAVVFHMYDQTVHADMHVEWVPPESFEAVLEDLCTQGWVLENKSVNL